MKQIISISGVEDIESRITIGAYRVNFIVSKHSVGVLARGSMPYATMLFPLSSAPRLSR
jgi:hypothetical protein